MGDRRMDSRVDGASAAAIMVVVVVMMVQMMDDVRVGGKDRIGSGRTGDACYRHSPGLAILE